VMIFSADPVADGLVSSLARPGGNVTGFTNYAAQLGAKRLDLLTEALPGISRVAALWDPAGADPGGELRELEAAALQRGARLVPIEVRTPDDLEAAFDTAVSEQAAGVLPLSGGVFFENHLRVVDLAAQKRLPAIYWVRRFVDAGGLMSYSSTLTAQYRRAADYVDRILRGRKPADLPVEQPMTFEFVVNLKTARALGITFPPQILLQVTEVVE
jgi:putative ABC transport system substrate-binding protein